jgi:hypothetical protein
MLRQNFARCGFQAGAADPQTSETTASRIRCGLRPTGVAGYRPLLTRELGLHKLDDVRECSTVRRTWRVVGSNLLSLESFELALVFCPF